MSDLMFSSDSSRMIMDTKLFALLVIISATWSLTGISVCCILKATDHLGKLFLV